MFIADVDPAARLLNCLGHVNADIGTKFCGNESKTNLNNQDF